MKLPLGETCFALAKKLTLSTCDHVYKNMNTGTLVWSVAQCFTYVWEKELSSYRQATSRTKKNYELTSTRKTS